MPSNRSLYKCKDSIEGISQLSKLYDIESIIFDNSLDVEKSKYIENKTLISIYNKNAPIEVFKNWAACMSTASRDYILMTGDDDRVNFLSSPDGFLKELPDSHVGIRPMFIPFSTTQGILSVESFSTDAETAKERIEQYFSLNNGRNLSFYSIYRKNILNDLMHEFYDYHPTKAGYVDWPLVLALTSMGKIKLNTNVIFYYNMDNWTSSEVIQSSNEDLFKKAGLPLDSMCIQSALIALDAFALIARKKSPLPTIEKYEASIYSMNMYFNGLIVALKSNNNKNIADKVKLSLGLLEIDVQDDSQKLINLLTIVETWIPGLAVKYQDYFKQIIDPEILEMIN